MPTIYSHDFADSLHPQTQGHCIEKCFKVVHAIDNKLSARVLRLTITKQRCGYWWGQRQVIFQVEWKIVHLQRYT